MLIECGAILFDSDGVLVDSHRQVAQAWSQLAIEFHLDAEVLLAELAGVRAIDTLSRHLSPESAAAAAVRLGDLELDLASSTCALDGALELLDALPAGSWTIVTSASRRLALARWRGAGVPFPRHVVTGDDITRGKPDPEPFLRGARYLNVAAPQCAVFEDSAAGGAAGESAGATVIAVGDQPWPNPAQTRVSDLHAVSVESSGGRLRLGLADG